MVSKLDLVHVYGPDLWREASKNGSEIGLKAKAMIDAGEEVSDDIMLDLLKEKLRSSDCASKGWVLEGHPTTSNQARGMLAAGLLPSRVLLLQLDDDEVMRRLTGRRVDPVGNAVYHLEDAPATDEEVIKRLVQRPEDTEDQVSTRLAAYRQSAATVLPHFLKVLSEVDGALPKDVLYEAIAPSISADMPSRAPRGCPRVVLLGGPGSRSEEVAEEVALQFGAKLISAPAILKAESLRPESVLGQLAKEEYLEKGNIEGITKHKQLDSMLRAKLLQRLQQEDVRHAGFVLHGFPMTKAHANFLDKHGVWIRHAVHLKMENGAAKRRVTAARVDPITGTMYHPDDPGWPSDPALLSRLVQPEHSSDAHVKKMLTKWRDRSPPLLKAFAAELEEVDATLPLPTMVEKLAHCFVIKPA